MRIAVFIKSTTFHEGYGGLETQNQSLCEGLVRRKNDVRVFSPQKELKFKTKYKNGVKYHFVPSVYRLTQFNKENWFFKSQEAFKKFHNENPFNLVVSQSSAGVGVTTNRKKYNVSTVSVSHGTIIGEFKTRLQSVEGFSDWIKLAKDTAFVLRIFFGRQRKFVHSSDKVIAVSGAVKEALINETFVSDSKVVVIHNGINPQKIEEASAKKLSDRSGKTVLYVGQILKSKGVFTLLDLAKEPEFSNINFEVIGGGPDFEELREKIEEENLAERFVLHGKLSYEEVLSYFKSPNMSLFAFPTRRVEGFPMVLVESLFAGLPIVAYDVGGVSDAIVNGETGFLIQSENYESFKEHVLNLLEDEKLTSKFSKIAKNYAHENFTIEKMLDKYEDVFKEVVLKK